MNAIDPRRSFGLDNRMTVVLFAGMGGGCDGYEDAGFHVHLAVNHDPIAVALHEKRHPHTKHLRCDVFEVDPRKATQGRGVRALHASPDCTHFSVAKGGKPVSKRRRSLAWVVPRWCGQVRPEVVTLENVPEIQTWGPLIAKRDPATGRAMRLDGSVAAKGERIPVEQQWLIPDPRHKGRIWRAWLKHMAGLGYHFEGRVLRCSDHGIPTIRKRFFGVATADGCPIEWPVRTHAPRDKAKILRLKPWVGMDTCVDFSRPVKSIFDRPIALKPATMRRIANGVMRRVINAADPFLMPITHSGAGNRDRSIFDPGATFTTANRGEMALIVASFMAQHSAGSHPGQPSRDIREPSSTLTAVGAQQGVVAVSMLNLRGTNRDGRDVRDPLSSLMAGGNHAGIVGATLVDMHGNSPNGRSVGEPGVALTGNSKAQLILGFLQSYYSSGGQDQALDMPLGALTAKARHGLVVVSVGEYDLVMTDIGSRMLEPEEGATSHGFEHGCLDHEITVWNARKGRMVTRKLTKTEKYHLVGNSVPPRMIELLARANVRRELTVAAE